MQVGTTTMKVVLLSAGRRCRQVHTLYKQVHNIKNIMRLKSAAFQPHNSEVKPINIYIIGTCRFMLCCSHDIRENAHKYYTQDRSLFDLSYLIMPIFTLSKFRINMIIISFILLNSMTQNYRSYSSSAVTSIDACYSTRVLRGWHVAN